MSTHAELPSSAWSQTRYFIYLRPGLHATEPYADQPSTGFSSEANARAFVARHTMLTTDRYVVQAVELQRSTPVS